MDSPIGFDADGNQLVASTVLSVLVTHLVALLRPFVEAIPAFADTDANKKRHDLVLQALNVLLNALVLFSALALSGDLHFERGASYVALIFYQFWISQGAYKLVAKFGGGNAAPSISLQPADPNDLITPAVEPDFGESETGDASDATAATAATATAADTTSADAAPPAAATA